ncbi:hypothetical protein N7490_006239 [Penicillium lividum]|nr:hypothetical protein N7490_006239 [Penicillium lividum]
MTNEGRCLPPHKPISALITSINLNVPSQRQSYDAIFTEIYLELSSLNHEKYKMKVELQSCAQDRSKLHEHARTQLGRIQALESYCRDLCQKNGQLEINLEKERVKHDKRLEGRQDQISVD